MYLSLTDEQSFLREAATGTLARRPTLEAARDALDGSAPLDLWDLAVEAGWPGLLAAESVEGTDLGAFEAALVLEACGARLADAGLLGHLPASLVLELAGADPEVRADIARGDRRAALVDGELLPGAHARDVDSAAMAESVVDAAGADLLVVVEYDRDRAVARIVDDAQIEPQPSYDATRRLGRVHVAPGRGTLLELPADVARQGRDLQRLLLAAESLGGADACLRMACDYAGDRYAFGRAIGSYQAIKHKLVEMLRRVEGARSLVAAAGPGCVNESFGLIANAARVAAAGAADFAAPENIFIHGGVGATWEHDASLFYRRAEVSRRLAGGVDAAAATVAELLLEGVGLPNPSAAEPALRG